MRLWTRSIVFWLAAVLLPVAIIQWPGAEWLLPLCVVALVATIVLAVRRRRTTRD